MPSGATHDRITLLCLPLVSSFTFLASRSTNITLSLAGSFLFSGLMFGPDLDIHSVQFNRWGMLRWIWRPYQAGLHHRSWLSHGPIIGTVLRLLYLGIWVLIFTLIAVTLAEHQGWVDWNWATATATVQHYCIQYRWELGAALVGLELGALSHIWSDRLGDLWHKFWHWRKRSRRRF
jgi:uncharacterized metal-binding protein